MKFKTLALITMVGLMSIPMAYAANSDDDLSTPAISSAPPTSDNIGSPSNDLASNTNMSSRMPSQSALSGDANDDISADTATGDDDY